MQSSEVSNFIFSRYILHNKVTNQRWYSITCFSFSDFNLFFLVFHQTHNMVFIYPGQVLSSEIILNESFQISYSVASSCIFFGNILRANKALAKDNYNLNYFFILFYFWLEIQDPTNFFSIQLRTYCKEFVDNPWFLVLNFNISHYVQIRNMYVHHTDKFIRVLIH